MGNEGICNNDFSPELVMQLQFVTWKGNSLFLFMKVFLSTTVYELLLGPGEVFQELSSQVWPKCGQILGVNSKGNPPSFCE